RSQEQPVKIGSSLPWVRPMVAVGTTRRSRVRGSARGAAHARCGLDPGRSLVCLSRATHQVLETAYRGLYFGGQLRRNARLDPDPGLLVVDALERAARADLLDERAGVVRQGRLDALPARRRGLGEPGTKRVEPVALDRRGEHGGRELGPERFAQPVPLLAA